MDGDALPLEAINFRTRAEMLRDGALVDVSDAARRAAFAWPVAITAAAYEDCVVWTAADNNRKGALYREGVLYDQDARLLHVLSTARWALTAAARWAIVQPGERTNLVVFEVRRVPRPGREAHARPVQLAAQFSQSDGGETVVTIMLVGSPPLSDQG
jgi:hypothetical protein